MNEVRAPAELVADLESWLRANTGVVDTPVPGTVAELLGRIVMRWHNLKVAGLEGARDGARRDRNIALEDNQRLREEIGAMRAANADHQQLVEALRAVNEQLREEIDSLKAALRARDAVITRLEAEANTAPLSDSHSEATGIPISREEALRIAGKTMAKAEAARQPTDASVMPVCSWCGKPMQPGTLVINRVQADGTLRPEHWWNCPPPGDAP